VVLIPDSCLLIPETIRVRSIVGCFLEHYRVFYFYAGGEEKVLFSGADWMERNFFRRIKVAFSILSRQKAQAPCNQRRVAAL
jgi:polyphosphate kinase